MKLSYKPRVKEPFVLELSTDELGLIRYYLNQSTEAVSSKTAGFKALSKLDLEKESVWKSSEKDLKKVNRVRDKLEVAVKTLKY